ncbi:hypothetical protein LRC39_03025 [Rhodopseudomonas sp. P1]|uniref:hypothetical protein n=1 Tax=Rhodopseudomonas sp. P1 TaxID=3434357 RepID=UPI0031FD7415
MTSLLENKVRRKLRGPTGRANQTAFRDLVQKLTVPNQLLGLTHITSSYVLRDIISSGKIVAPEVCGVLGEAVTYAFYGRSAFRGTSDFEPASLACLFPTVLVLDPTLVPSPKYVFAFDSGAFVKGYMDQYLHPYMPLFDFLLAPEPQSAARLVSTLFGSAEDFLRNAIEGELNVPGSNFEADCYKRMVLASMQAVSGLDDRVSTPELVFGDPIELKKCVCAAIIPDSLASDPDIGGRLKAYGIPIHEYPFSSGSRPIENHATVRALVHSVYQAKGWL